MNKPVRPVHALRVARHFCAPDWSWEPRGIASGMGNTDGPAHFHFVLWTIIQGLGWLEAPETTYDLSAGDCFILRGDESYRGTHDPNDPLVVFAVRFDYLASTGKPVFPNNTRLHHHLTDPTLMFAIFDRMEAAWSRDEAGREAVDLWLAACLEEREVEHTGLRGEARRQAANIQALCTDIRRSPADAPDIEAMAARCHCSPRHFCRLFKNTTGMPPKQFIIRARLDVACGLLLGSSYPIARIAELTGFGDIYYFSRFFKKQTGHTPTAYRNGSR